ncbi:MAG: holo-ACP synthase [Pseudonocardiaceae bacterium]|nr:holo-ACP synthase [Pseudonocardiaceae bacterium]
MIAGVGTDIVGVVRFEHAVTRTPGVLPRVFTEAERVTRSGAPRRPRSLAARFAAKEAAAKALGVPRGWGWHDTEVVAGPNGRPLLRVTGSLGRAAEQQGVTAWHVSLTHDADLAAAIVVAEVS